MKLKSAFIILLPILCILILTTIVLAEEAPAPYAGMKNPFAWNDAAAQTAGKALYRKSCLSCHGDNGNEVVEADFSTSDYPKRLESNPGFVFWRVSEGIVDTEMASYKFTVSETQRWQIMTYMWSLGGATPAGGDGKPTTPSGPTILPTLSLSPSEQAEAGQPIHLSALLQDQDGKPVADAQITFSINVTFFASGLAEIGKAVTDANGVASINYTTGLTGNIPIVARYQTDSRKFVTATSIARRVESEELYEPEVGLPYKGFPPDLVLFPASGWETIEPGIAPVTVIRIPGGLPFIPFMSYVGVVILVWVLFFHVMYQVFRIPAVADRVKSPNARLLPMVGMVIIALLGIGMVLMLITGPYFVSN